MNEIGRGTKVQVNISISEELLREAASLTPDLSTTVEALLTDFVAKRRLDTDADQQALDAFIAEHNAYVETYGLPGAEFSPL